MENRLFHKLIFIIYSLLIFSTIAALIIVYKNISNPLAYKFVVFYVIFLLFSAAYFIACTAKNMFKLNKLQRNKRILRFILYFISITLINYVLEIIFKLPNRGILRSLSTPLGFAFGLTFFDLVFKREKQSLKYMK